MDVAAFLARHAAAMATRPPVTDPAVVPSPLYPGMWEARTPGGVATFPSELAARDYLTRRARAIEAGNLPADP